MIFINFAHSRKQFCRECSTSIRSNITILDDSKGYNITTLQRSSNLYDTHSYIFVIFYNTIKHQLYIIIVLRYKFQFIRFGAHFSLSFQNVTQISLYSIILQFAMSGFAITTFFQLLDLIIKAIIIAIFCDIAQINYNVKDLPYFY